MSYKEKDLQKEVIDILSKNKVFFERANCGKIKSKYGGWIILHTAGFPDIFVLRNGVFYGLELKVGHKQTKEQVEMGKSIEANGGRYFLIRSVKEVIELFDLKHNIALID